MVHAIDASLAKRRRRPCHRSVPAYLQERLAADPTLTAVRLGRELKERGFAGASTAVKRAVATIQGNRVNAVRQCRG